MTEKAKKERELIAKIQRDNDIFAMKMLLREYRGIIRQCVRDANLSSVMSESDAIAYAENQFKHIIKENYDLSKNIQPSTFVINSLTPKLRTLRYKNINTTSRMSSDLAMKAGYMSHAIPMLQRKGIENPSEKQIVEFVKNDMGRAPKFTQKEAARISGLSRTEVSADLDISPDSGTSPMTLGDTLDSSSVSAKSLLEEKFLKDRVEEIISGPNYSRNERVFLRRMYQIGPYKNIKPKNIHQAALNSGIADVSARRALNKLEKELKK